MKRDASAISQKAKGTFNCTKMHHQKILSTISSHQVSKNQPLRLLLHQKRKTTFDTGHPAHDAVAGGGTSYGDMCLLPVMAGTAQPTGTSTGSSHQPRWIPHSLSGLQLLVFIMTQIDIFHYIRSPSAPSDIHHSCQLCFSNLLLDQPLLTEVHEQYTCSCLSFACLLENRHHCRKTTEAISQIQITRARTKDIRNPSLFSVLLLACGMAPDEPLLTRTGCLQTLSSSSLWSYAAHQPSPCCMHLRLLQELSLVQRPSGEKFALTFLLVTRDGIRGQLAGGMTKLGKYYPISPSIGRDRRCHIGSCNGKLHRGSQQDPFMKSRSSSANMINSLERRWQ